MKTNGYVELVTLSRLDRYWTPRLCYDRNTKIIYIMTTSLGDSYNDGMSLCPYFSENGKLCRYDTETKEIQEIL